MAVDSRGADGHPIFLGTSAPATADDLTTLGEEAYKRGTRLAGSSAARGSYAYAQEGLSWWDTDESREYVYQSGNWVRRPIVYAGEVTITPSAPNTPTPGSATFPAGLFPSAPKVTTSVSNPVAAVGISNVTTSGFDLSLVRTSTTNTVVQWIAVLN